MKQQQQLYLFTAKISLFIISRLTLWPGLRIAVCGSPKQKNIYYFPLRHPDDLSLSWYKIVSHICITCWFLWSILHLWLFYTETTKCIRCVSVHPVEYIFNFLSVHLNEVQSGVGRRIRWLHFDCLTAFSHFPVSFSSNWYSSWILLFSLLSVVGSVVLSSASVKVSSAVLRRRTVNQQYRHTKGRQSTPTEPPIKAAFISEEKITKESMDTILDFGLLSDWLTDWPANWLTDRPTDWPTDHDWPRGVLRISSDGDDRRIFLGLKFLIPGYFFFWVAWFK